MPFRSRNYYTLVASLPNLPPHFQVERLPISRQRLLERLKMLHEDDAAVIDQVVNFFIWDRQPLDRTDDEVIARYDHLMHTIDNRLVRRLINDRMNVRTVVSAIRRRRSGLTPPRGVGQFVDHIRRNWQHPDFKLGGRLPWVAEMQEHMAAGTAAAGDDLLLSTNWQFWTNLSLDYTFSFEAVILYLARWEVIDRWTTRDHEAGRQRFEHLITETLGEYEHLG